MRDILNLQCKPPPRKYRTHGFKSLLVIVYIKTPVALDPTSIFCYWSLSPKECSEGRLDFWTSSANLRRESTHESRKPLVIVHKALALDPYKHIFSWSVLPKESNESQSKHPLRTYSLVQKPLTKSNNCWFNLKNMIMIRSESITKCNDKNFEHPVPIFTKEILVFKIW